MNESSTIPLAEHEAQRVEGSPILLVPYMWIGDFVRCHSVVTLLRERYPDRPVDILGDFIVRAASRLYAGA